jgi:ascorbate-specific PTS system EIIC-type component UlaA
MGYLLAPILFINASLGLYNGVITGTKNIVLLHSVSGSLAILVLVWILIEIRYPTERSLTRVRIASYLSVFLVTAGCWIGGGYNYLTSYGSKVKPVILTGPSPWAHEIIMEMKEHIFIFLPIIALSLSITLSILDRETFLLDDKLRKALTIIALLVLFMVLLMFLMGAIISNAGQIGTEA